MARSVEIAKLSSKGQLVIPKKMRDALSWNTGENVTVELKKDQLILRKLTLEDILTEAESDWEKGKTVRLWPEKNQPMWQVHGSTRIAKLLESMDKAVHEKYRHAFSQLAKTPRSRKLLKGYDNVRSFPVTTPGGEHRIIYQIKQEEKVVYVVLIGKQGSVYEILRRSSIP